MPILIDQRYVRRLLCILLHFGNGFGKRESAGSQDPHVIQEGVDLLVYIVAGSAPGNLDDGKRLCSIQASAFKILRDRHYIIDFPVEEAVLDDRLVIGHVFNGMVLFQVGGHSLSQFPACLLYTSRCV